MTFHTFGTGSTRSIVLQRYKIFWERPNGTRLPGLRRTMTSCALTQHAFLIRTNFTKGAKITVEVGLTTNIKYYRL
jgi:hypothetical protein